MFKCRQKSLVFLNMVIVVMMHPLLCNLHIVLVQKLPIFFAMHYCWTNLLRHPILSDSEDSCSLASDVLRWGGCSRNCKILDSKPLKILESVGWLLPPRKRQLMAVVLVFCIFILKSFPRTSWYNSFSHNIFAGAVLSWSSGVASLTVLSVRLAGSTSWGKDNYPRPSPISNRILQNAIPVEAYSVVQQVTRLWLTQTQKWERKAVCHHLSILAIHG